MVRNNKDSNNFLQLEKGEITSTQYNVKRENS